MTDTNGKHKLTLVIADADALIALANPDDAHHETVRAISEYLATNEIAILFPVTAIFEAVTTLQRKLTKPELAQLINEKASAGELPIQYINAETFSEATKLFNPHGSKQNTLYDALVATLAKQLNALAIFSFDGWYKKQGFTLAKELMEEEKAA